VNRPLKEAGLPELGGLASTGEKSPAAVASRPARRRR